MSFLKYRIRNIFIPLFPWAFEWAESAKLFLHGQKWRNKGFTVPLPNILKRSILLREVLAHKADTFVETGTFLGDTPWFLRKHVKNIITIEVHPPLAELNKTRYKGNPNIQVIQGDSGDVLSDIVPKLTGRVVFWLDGHYSKGITGMGVEECPIFRELRTIIDECKADWLVMIDDARDFGKDPSYPTVDQVTETFIKKGIQVLTTVENDIIKICRVTL